MDDPEDSAEKTVTEALGEVSVSGGADSDPAQDSPQAIENGAECTFSYERLKAKSTNPAKGIDYKRREVRPREPWTLLWNPHPRFMWRPWFSVGLPLRCRVPGCPWDAKRGILSTAQVEAGHAEEEGRPLLMLAASPGLHPAISFPPAETWLVWAFVMLEWLFSVGHSFICI